MTVVVRPAGDADVAGLARLRATWTGQDQEPEFERRFGEWFEQERNNRTVFVAEQADGELVGMMSLALFERMPRPGRPDSRWGYLSNAFVLAEHRDHGIGAVLLDAVTAHARAVGCVRVVLAPSERAIPFYERGGFGPATMLMAQVLDSR